MMRRTFVLVGGALIAVGLAVLAYNLFGFVSHVLIWREGERLGIAIGVLIFTDRFTIIAQYLSPYLPTF